MEGEESVMAAAREGLGAGSAGGRPGAEVGGSGPGPGPAGRAGPMRAAAALCVWREGL